MRLLLILGVLVTFISCKKEPGIGGLNTITGRVNAIYVEKGSFDTLDVTGYAETRVYIVYGTDSIHDDDVRTSADGSFKFEHLHPGEYKLFTYSENLLVASGQEAQWKSITLDKGRNTVALPEFTVLNYVNP